MTHKQQRTISKLIDLEMSLGTRGINDGQRVIRNERMCLETAGALRIEDHETLAEFAARKQASIARHIAEANRVAALWS